MSKNKRLSIIGSIILVGCILMTIVICNCSEKIHMKYKDFNLKVVNNEVKEVEIQNQIVLFTLKSGDNLYYTENPDYDTFKEYLLLNDVKIRDSFGEDEILIIFDILFYLIFVGAATFGAYKVLSFNRNNFKIIKNNNTKFDDIVGMEDLKKDLIKITDILKSPEMYKEKGIRAPKGIILEGPPGNGKTLFARAIAGETSMNFIATKGADFQSAMMSIGPRKIKALFKKARRNKPCIIFIDEFDGIGERRSYAGTGIDKENNRLIITMLNEMDGFTNEDGVLVIAATNSYLSLDGALVRPGRFDIKYKVDNPNKEMRIKLIEMYANKKLDSKIKVDELAKCFENLSAAAIETIINESILISEMNQKETVKIQDIAEAGKKTGIVNIKICN